MPSVLAAVASAADEHWEGRMTTRAPQDRASIALGCAERARTPGWSGYDVTVLGWLNARAMRRCWHSSATADIAGKYHLLLNYARLATLMRYTSVSRVWS
jgi:hypothetical protein